MAGASSDSAWDKKASELTDDELRTVWDAHCSDADGLQNLVREIDDQTLLELGSMSQLTLQEKIKAIAGEHKNLLFILDRDGVVNDNPIRRPKDSKHPDNYVRTLEEFKFFKDSKEAIEKMIEAGHKVGVATNQAGLARQFCCEGCWTKQGCEKGGEPKMEPYIEREQVDLMHDHLSGETGIPREAIKLCPHYGKSCECRKPSPKMLKAIEDFYDCSKEQAIMIGDGVGDLEAGKANEVPLLVFILTGQGLKNLAKCREKIGAGNFLIARDLADAQSQIEAAWQLVLQDEEVKTSRSALGFQDDYTALSQRPVGMPQ